MNSKKKVMGDLERNTSGIDSVLKIFEITRKFCGADWWHNAGTLSTNTDGDFLEKKHSFHEHVQCKISLMK